MKVDTEILEDRQAKLVVTLNPEQVQREMKSAARRIARKVNIPGFRKGKAPYHIIVQYFGEAAIWEEALDPLAQSAYSDALEESGIEPYAPGVVTDMQLEEPVALTFTVPLPPEVDLGDYRAVRVEPETGEVDEEDVEQTLQSLRDRNATLDPVERPIEMGDVAMLDIVGTLVRDADTEASEPDADTPAKPAVWVNREGVRVKIAEDATYPVPGFPRQVVGMAPGDERSFDMTFPADDEDLAEALRGKTLHFEVRCAEVYTYQAPELDDEFARDLGDYEDLDALRAEIRTDLSQMLERVARDRYLEQVFDTLLDSVVTVRYPPVMVEDQIDHLLEDLENELRERGLNLEEYRRINQLDEDELREQYREQASRQVAQMIVLREVIEAEKLKVTDSEIEDEIATMTLSYGENAGLMRQFFSSPQIRRSIEQRLLVQKGTDRLVAIARGEAPEPGAEEAGEEEAEPEAEAAVDEPAADAAAAAATEAEEDTPPAPEAADEPATSDEVES